MPGRNRKQEDPAYQDQWYGEQCGACTFFIPLEGVIGLDWGGCTNEASPLDGRIVFEHDGCGGFRAGIAWD